MSEAAADLIVVTIGDPPVVALRGDWGRAPQVPISSDTASKVVGGKVQRVIIDGRQLESPHPRAAAFIYALTVALDARDVSVSYRDIGDDLGALINLATSAAGAKDDAAGRSPKLTERVGRSVGEYYLAVGHAFAFFGRAAASTPAFVMGRSQMRWRDFAGYLQETGAASLPVVTVVNLLVGAVLGFVGAVQLKTFGAGIYLADLVGVSVAREMASLMTAFVMSGRVGAAFAAHLATMQTNEEVDALRMTGVSPFDFLVMPRLAALSIMLPLLYLYAAAVGIIGGLLVGMLIIGTPPMAFIHQLHVAVATRQFAIGFAKSICFGVLIALTSCYIGLNAGRNAAEVGRAATRTVVLCIIGIILVDAVFAVCTNALGI